MLYLLYGTNPEKSRAKLHELVESLLKKKPDASHLRITDENFSEANLEELISSPGLFASKTIVEVDNAFRNKEAKPVILEKLKDIKESENIFVMLEGELLKLDVKKFEKYAEKVQEFGTKGEEDVKERKDFNIFSLTDALGRKDKKQLWVLYTKAKRKNIADEEIHGILFWQIKAIFLAARMKSASEAGLNPFVFQKSQGFLKNYSKHEVHEVSSKLVSIYHDARRGIHDMGSALEKFILEM
jgi:DNA polymerase III delta subunit